MRRRGLFSIHISGFATDRVSIF